jgi:hypothetical protein
VTDRNGTTRNPGGVSPQEAVGRVLPRGLDVWSTVSARPSHAPAEVTVNLKKVLTWLVVAFVVFYVIQAPENSAEIVRSAGQALGDAASSLASFVGSLI